MPRVRDYDGIAGRELVRAEFMLPAALMKKLSRVARAGRERSTVRGRDQVVCEVLGLYLDTYVRDVLGDRAKEAPDA
jgi:hypothetical protein